MYHHDQASYDLLHLHLHPLNITSPAWPCFPVDTAVALKKVQMITFIFMVCCSVKFFCVNNRAANLMASSLLKYLVSCWCPSYYLISSVNWSTWCKGILYKHLQALLLYNIEPRDIRVVFGMKSLLYWCSPATPCPPIPLLQHHLQLLSKPCLQPDTGCLSGQASVD